MEILDSPDPARVLAVRAVGMWAAQASGQRVPEVERVLEQARDAMDAYPLEGEAEEE